MITRETVAQATKATTARFKALWLGSSKTIWATVVLRLKLGTDATGTGLRHAATFVHSLRKLWLFLIETIGVVLVSWGISFWSIPSAVIIGGLILVAVIEIRPLPGPKFPDIPVPEEALRHQAQFAAEAINNERFGLAMVDPKALEKLTLDECEKIITLAKTVGARRV
jgi:hypothetical protein